MKRIINIKLYDTDTVTKIGCYYNGYGTGDFKYKREVLYKKKTGEYFIYGGSPFTEYCETKGNMSCYGEAIIPMLLEDAKSWAEFHMNADAYISEFGEVEE